MGMKQKSSFSRSANSQYFFRILLWIGPLVSRIDCCKGHWCGSIYMVMRLSTSKTGKNAYFVFLACFWAYVRQPHVHFDSWTDRSSRIFLGPVLKDMRSVGTLPCRLSHTNVNCMTGSVGVFNNVGAPWLETLWEVSRECFSALNWPVTATAHKLTNSSEIKNNQLYCFLFLRFFSRPFS